MPLGPQQPGHGQRPQPTDTATAARRRPRSGSVIPSSAASPKSAAIRSPAATRSAGPSGASAMAAPPAASRHPTGRNETRVDSSSANPDARPNTPGHTTTATPYTAVATPTFRNNPTRTCASRVVWPPCSCGHCARPRDEAAHLRPYAACVHWRYGPPM